LYSFLTRYFKDIAFDNLSEVLENLQITTQEPWPKDVKLFQPYEVEQILLPDNANCLAVQAFLKMCNLDFQVEPRANAEAMSPSGKVPFIKAGAFVISELEPIVQFVNNKGISLTDKLDPEMKSDMRAYMSLVHNVMEVAEVSSGFFWVNQN
jgi:metaxin